MKKKINKTRKCLDCGVDISHRVSKSVRCKPCQYLKNVENKKEWHKKHRKEANKRYYSKPGKMEKKKEYADKYREENKDYFKEYHKEYVKRPGVKKRMKAYAKQYYKDNKERIKEYTDGRKDRIKETRAKWLEDPKNRDLIRALGSKSRTKRRSLVDDIGFNRVKVIGQLRERDGLKCMICGKRILKKDLYNGNLIHVDHRIPVIKGGSNDLKNLQLAHASCNRQKGSKLI